MNQTNHQIRIAAFNWLEEQTLIHGDVLPRTLLEKGFNFNGQRITLMGPKGIWKPASMTDVPLSITTTISGPYNDSCNDDGLLVYNYRGDDPAHPDNVGLREAKRLQAPLIYFHAIVKGKYLAVWPVYVVHDDPSSLSVTVAVDDAKLVQKELENEYESLKVAEGAETEIRRRYITATIRQRLHQRSFRERVLRAYREQCTLCRLRHMELLDAAHIIPDHDEGGDPKVTNGLSLCKIHHAAFDRQFIGITPDYEVEVRADILEEEDGPMLRWGLQEMHGKKLLLPGRKEERPDRDLLDKRYQLFKTAV